MSSLVRFGISISKTLLSKFDQLITEKGYSNRSEAIRDLIRNELVEAEWSDSEHEVAGTITLAYNHHVRGLSDLLTDLQHNYHHLILTTTHVHLDHDHCLEVLVVKGKVIEIQKMADRLIGVKGIKHGKLAITSTAQELA